MFPLVQYISNFYDDQSDKSKIFASEKLNIYNNNS